MISKWIKMILIVVVSLWLLLNIMDFVIPKPSLEEKLDIVNKELSLLKEEIENLNCDTSDLENNSGKCRQLIDESSQKNLKKLSLTSTGFKVCPKLFVKCWFS